MGLPPSRRAFLGFSSFTFTLRKEQLAGGFTACMAHQRQALLEVWPQARPDTWFMLMLEPYGMNSGGSSIPMPSADCLRQVLEEANPLAIRGVLFNPWAGPQDTETIGDRIQAELSSAAGPYLDAVRHGATLCSDGEPGPPCWEPLEVADGRILLRFTARPGMSHTVEYATELPAINCNVLIRVPETAETVEVVVADPVGPLPRFYRVRSPWPARRKSAPPVGNCLPWFYRGPPAGAQPDRCHRTLRNSRKPLHCAALTRGAERLVNNIELIICLLLLFMAVPDFCSKLGRPALVFPAFIVFGLLLSPFANPQIRTLLEQAGQVGFLLLLFEVGLEIDLPPPREFLRPLLHALGWALVQFPPLVAAALWMGMDTTQALLAATALTACSVGLAHAAWKSYPGLSGDRKVFVLHGMVALEVVAVVFLALGSTILRTGLTWMVLAKMAGIVATVLLLARFALHLNRLFQTVLEHTTHWRIHWLVLLVLVVCALGERLGLDAAKTAFFLGLAMSRVQHHGLTIEECIAPISRRFLIPVFFVALGLNLQWSWLLDRTALWALGTTGALLALRAFLHRHAFRWDGDARVFLLFCPNLTIVALAAKAMLDASGEPRIVAWLLLTGLFMSIASVALLPSGGNNHTVATGQTAPQP